MEKRWLETLMTKEAADDFGLDVNDLIKVRRKNGTYYVYKEEVSKEVYEEINREDWKYQKRRQRMFKEMAEDGVSIIPLHEVEKMKKEDRRKNVNHFYESEIENMAVKHLMLEALAEEIEKLPDFDRKLMKLVFHSDLTQRQLAEILGVSVWKINTSIKKNKEILKNNLTR